MGTTFDHLEGGQVVENHAYRRPTFQIRRYGNGVPCGHCNITAVSSHDGHCGYPVTLAKIPDLLPNGLDVSDHIVARRNRQLYPGVNTFPHHDISKGDTSGLGP